MPWRDRLDTAIEVRPHERRRFWLFAQAFFLVSAGIEFGRIGRDSYFLTTAGVAAVPMMYVYTALVMVVAAPIYDRLVHRLSPARLMAVMQVSGGVACTVAWAWIAFVPSQPPAFAHLLYPAVEGYLLFLLMHFWKFANTAFDAWEGKRLFPFLGGAGLMGALVAGGLSRLLSGTVGAEHLFGVWAMCLLATLPLTGAVGRAAAETVGTPMAAPEARLADVIRQPLLRTLSYMALPMWIIIYIIEYTYFETATRVFQDQDQLAGFLGMIVSLSAAIGLLMQFTLTPRLLGRVGVGATCLVYPAMLTAGTIALLIFSLFPGSSAERLPLAGIALLVVFARLCDLAFFFSVHDSSQQLLFYGVPEALRDKARVLMQAVVSPISFASAGGILMVFAARGEPEHNLAFVAIVLAFLLMVIGMSITPEYLQSLLAHLDPAKVGERAEVLGEIARLEKNDARYVLLRSVTSGDLDEALFAIDHLFSMKDPDLIEDILESGARMRVEAVRDVARRMSDEEKVAHGVALAAALADADTVTRS